MPDKKSIQPYENVKRSPKEIIVNNFLGGISWAVGATIGLSIILFVISKVNLIPVIGDFVAQVTHYVETQQFRNYQPSQNR